MERIDFINVSRILWCCQDLGITPYELGDETGISKNTIQNLLENGDGLTFNQLRAVSEFCGRGMLFFLENEEVEPNRVHTPAFRTLANQKPELSQKLKLLIERVEKHRDVYLSLREELGLDRQDFQAPNTQNMSIAEAARTTRAWLGLRDSNNFDSYREAVEAKGILVFRSNGYNGRWQIAKESPIIGFVLYEPTCPVIVVKKQSWETQQAFTLMHELGHIIMHRSSSIDDEQDLLSHDGMESEANAFAGNLLVPPNFLAMISDAERPRDVSLYDSWLDNYRRRWGISVEVILRRLLDSNRLARQDYANYRQWRSAQPLPEGEGGNRQYRHREPTHIFGSPYVKTVLDSLSSKKITLTKASKYLDGINLRDIHQLEEFYARS
jgi:Zn-dependent peptidase ImmA (M78 family)